jgi:hypothetical protein
MAVSLSLNGPRKPCRPLLSNPLRNPELRLAAIPRLLGLCQEPSTNPQRGVYLQSVFKEESCLRSERIAEGS